MAGAARVGKDIFAAAARTTQIPYVPLCTMRGSVVELRQLAESPQIVRVTPMKATSRPRATATPHANENRCGCHVSTLPQVKKTMHEESMVLVLDDDRRVRTDLQRLLKTHGFGVRLHSEPQELLHHGLPTVPACLLLDNRLHKAMTGVDVHEELLRRDWSIPTVFLADDWNVPMVVNAMRAGADGFLTKPFNPAEVVDAVALALQRSSAKQQQGTTAVAARLKLATLTLRELEIVRMVIEGMLNKEIADALDLALITVKVHRGHAMKKLGVANPAELARLVRLASSTQ